ncbi:MAG: DUF3572 family protein [Pseudomonadota bacterium]
MVTRDKAEAAALLALQHIASSETLLTRFLDISGLTPETVREAAGDPAFLAAAFDFLREDDAECGAFAANQNLSVQELEAISHILSGGRSYGN